MAKETPLMKQYNQIKSKYPDALLLFRVGDFYETFGEDAVKAAHTLDIVLTNRNNGSERSELAGFPYHSINTYLPKLVKAGYRVAICDQLEDPKLVKGIVKRGVTELVTPGVALNDDILQSKNNNFLASVWLGKQLCGIAFLDISTGEFLVAQGDKPYIDKLLQNFKPSEILIAKQQKKAFTESFGEDFHCFFLEDWVFKDDYARQALTKHFQTNSLKGFGVDELTEAILTAGAILYYLSETQHHQLQHITTLQRIAEDAYVWLDRFTIRNLELYAGSSAQSVTLIDVIDKTLSPMGSRTLKRWLALPLKKIEKMTDIEEVLTVFKHPTDLFSFNEKAINFDFDLLTNGRISQSLSETNGFLGNKEDIFMLLKQDEKFADYTMEQLLSDLEALVKWKNLTPIQDPGRVYTIADYKNKQYRYTMSEYAVEIERLTVRLENIFVESGNLSTNFCVRGEAIIKSGLSEAIVSMFGCARVRGEHEEHSASKGHASFWVVIAEIAVLDIVFSLDSVITAVGMANHIEIMILAVILAVGVMMFASKGISNFVDNNPTIKILALAFLILIGFTLVGEGLGMHVPKGYVYFAMAFSLGVELINIYARKKSAKRAQEAQK